MRQILCYIASPISLGNLRDNIRRACDVGVRLIKAGLSVIIPHLSCYAGQVYDGAGCIPVVLAGGITHSTWLDVDFTIVSRCNCLLRLPGDSVGADMEVAEANRLGIPVFHDEGELLAWARNVVASTP